MKTQQEVEAKLKELLDDERLSYPPAKVFENALLALIQHSLDSQCYILRWVLKDNNTKVGSAS